MTPSERMTDEVVIQAAIKLLQKKLAHIRCLSGEVSVEDYQRMKQLSDSSGIHGSANSSSV